VEKQGKHLNIKTKHKMKKNRILFGLILSAILLGLASCENNSSQSISDIEGSYVGSFSKSTSLKSTLIYSSGEHDEADEHPGGFDMVHGTFSYSFRMMENLTPYYLKFHGIKN